MNNTNSKYTNIIVNKALALFKEKGYSKVSVNEICKAANIQRYTFYNIFSNKDDLIIYLLKNLPGDYKDTISSFIEAENDLDRIWILYEKYLNRAIDLGPELTSIIFKIELDRNIGAFLYADDYINWFIKLFKKCQETGVVRNMNSPEALVPMGIRLTLTVVYEWCMAKGSFPLKEKAFKITEDFYEIAPEYRRY